MWALLLAVQLRALGEDDYLLTKYDPVTSYVSTEGSYCAGKNIHVLDHPLTRVAQHSCVTTPVLIPRFNGCFLISYCFELFGSSSNFV